MTLRRILLFAVVVGPLAGSMALADPAIVRTKPGTLEHYLAGRLLVTTPNDAAYLDDVADAVRRGNLPESLVRGTCEWAAVRAIRQGVRYPFPSFRKALDIKARRLGVEL